MCVCVCVYVHVCVCVCVCVHMLSIETLCILTFFPLSMQIVGLLCQMKWVGGLCLHDEKGFLDQTSAVPSIIHQVSYIHYDYETFLSAAGP